MRTRRVRSHRVSAVDAVGSPFRDEHSEQIPLGALLKYTPFLGGILIDVFPEE